MTRAKFWNMIGLALVLVCFWIIFDKKIISNIKSAKKVISNIISARQSKLSDSRGLNILEKRVKSGDLSITTSSQTTPFAFDSSYLTPHPPEITAIDNTTQQRGRRQGFPSKDLPKPEGKFQKSHFMTVRVPCGRLGNQIFQFAALLGVSALHGYTPCIIPSTRLRAILETFYINVTYKSNITNVKKFQQESVAKYGKSIETLDHTRNWTLAGCFQSWRYFGHIAERIRKKFKIKGKFLKKASKIMAEINVFNKTVIGVHVRRSDFNTRQNLANGFTVGSKQYLTKAMSYYKMRYRNPIFIVASDDPEWSRKTLRGGDVHVMTKNSAAVHFAVLTLANHTIITSGTYGWMGGFLAGGEVVYFKGFPRKGSGLAQVFNRSDYYPPFWIGMD